MCEKKLYIHARVYVVGDDVNCNFLKLFTVRADYCKYYLMHIIIISIDYINTYKHLLTITYW